MDIIYWFFGAFLVIFALILFVVILIDSLRWIINESA